MAGTMDMRRRRRLGLISLCVAVFAGSIQCRTAPESVATSQRSALVQSLAEIKGAYVWRADLTRHDYSEKLQLEAIISAGRRDAMLASLIDCLDDTTASASTVDGKPVAVGLVCYQALSQLAYYEPTARTGDIAESWPGFLTPLASPDAMRAAKTAWKKAADAKLVIFH